ncbi:hypothetical protein [uncultured Desulfobulbus sp.]|uniref:hypothetical protein n=1 Tax=uncultured Desulfobulbus sp. TaxID=239745 RepID=UPI00374DD025
MAAKVQKYHRFLEQLISSNSEKDIHEIKHLEFIAITPLRLLLPPELGEEAR